jgi:RNA polymerase sigma-70 factor (ECF subfamily)
MTSPERSEDAAAAFEPLRPMLMRLAYRMLGSVADAEDMVQEAFIRWMKADRAEVRSPEAFLCRTVAHLCLDRIRAVRRLREDYVGPWLPDPIVEEDSDEDVTLPLMLVMERLSPLERAAFLLHDVFGAPFDEVATILQRDAAACRQLAARARTRVRDARPRFAVEKRHGVALAEAFFTASRSGDMQALGKMLCADVSIHADGGGKRPTALAPILGRDAALDLFTRVIGLLGPDYSTLVRFAFVNGLPGFVTVEADGHLQTTALDIEVGRIAAIYVMRNPDKLRHLQ